jgi:hypothetical protein
MKLTAEPYPFASTLFVAHINFARRIRAYEIALPSMILAVSADTGLLLYWQ